MALIQNIAQKAINIGYLSNSDYNQIQALLKTNFDSEDLDALIILQRAIAAGDVKRESSYLSSSGRDNKSSIQRAYQIAAEMTFAAAVALTRQKNHHDQPSLG
ncbi:hypothetical protein [Nostoc sp. TCL26-01]|uniref:hypothetical protein n=1 Tax=Nostoc sp. TCL26-01 TaxID=2576904 RepID=UPI0015C078BE|nr:hypothetical protein [Nostoc sp. TCL26-01]QLE55515.1 hypothetical protein FD725_08295 [Nostoc sp. TCL26-01]